MPRQVAFSSSEVNKVAVHRRLMEKLSEGIYSAEVLRALEAGVTKLAISQERGLLRLIDEGDRKLLHVPLSNMKESREKCVEDDILIQP